MVTIISGAPPGLPPRSGVYLGFAIFFLIFCTLLVVLRFRSRYLLRAPYGVDDWFMLAALPCFYGQMATQLYALLGGGLGWHTDQVADYVVENLLMELTIIQFTYAATFLFIRLSIATLFLRIFPQPWIHRIIYIFIVFATLWSLFVIITAVSVCVPFKANWTLSLSQTHCNSSAKKASYVINAVWSILYDTSIWILPQFCVWKLHMKMITKITLSAVFALAIFDIVVSIVRIVEINSLSFDDITYASWGGHFWSQVEIGVAMIVACAPMCRQAFEEWLPRRWRPAKTIGSTFRSDVVHQSNSDDYHELHNYHSDSQALKGEYNKKQIRDEV